MASSISGAKAQRKIMLPRMCDQLPCMNIAVRIVIQWWPETICAGIADHWVTKLSPFINSSTKTKAFTRMMKTVTTGMRAGRRDASLNGIKPPMFPHGGLNVLQTAQLTNHAALNGDTEANAAVALRTANDSSSRVTPLMIRLTPTRVPIAQAELDGHCR